ncbi:TrbG/VirB9 family P-type conjugative transfer protein [Vibrio harveyi]|uniref:TrbG/VirB9 family P-type conjugative transfer protein n=1 Tax=Vibrio harveyi TaxID=669 RepID=UPI003CEF2F02
MQTKRALLCALILGAISTPSLASTCDMLNYQSGDLIRVNSAPNLGSRIELPSNLIKPPVITNARRWNVGSEVGTNQIVVAPNSHEKDGAQAMLFAFTQSGKVYDILVTRSSPKQHTPCVIVSEKPSFIFAPTPPPKPKPKPKVVKPKPKPRTLETVGNTGSNFPQIFAAYKWDKYSLDYPENLIGSVYDDGRTTFVRLDSRHQGELTIEAEVNGINTLLPVDHDKDYTVFSFHGVYTSFVLHVDNSSVRITRS